MSSPHTVAVVGAGWAGCAAAAELTSLGSTVCLLEASEELGGRARRLLLELAGQVHVLDNGQHLLLGAYSETAAAFDQIGVALDSVVERRPFEVQYPADFRLRAGALQAPWHLAAGLLTARGMACQDRLALVRLLRRLKSARWNIGPDRDIAGWLHECGQTPHVIRRIWRPLALAALNTPLERASAQIFVNVLRDSLGADGRASEMWVPRSDLSAIFPDAVARYVLAHGGEVRRDARVERITVNRKIQLQLRNKAGGTVEADAVVYAGSPAHLSDAIGHLGRLAPALEQVSRFAYEPLYTVYLKYPPHVRIRGGFCALLDDPPRRRYAQWVFDRGAFDSHNAGILAAVISSSGPHEAESLQDVCDAVAAQLSKDLHLPAPLDTRAIAERRATLAMVADLRRPSNRTPCPGLALAGDWTESEHPSTLETAVRSGRAAARILRDENLGR